METKAVNTLLFLEVETPQQELDASSEALYKRRKRKNRLLLHSSDKTCQFSIPLLPTNG